ncbi:MAG: hypothetical protein KAJ79_08625 [Candidatus Omnitrophica bacterium]|nr:hypothetical protein [Candidatus Omnitrophota bacterium]MCK5289116.1 hypothetical protein [Candidatus Omnitrophota bacterium]
MVEKIFKIRCNSEEFLNEEIIAYALLKQITLNQASPDTFFAVLESTNKKNIT